jgi:hypothetical protein
MPAPVMFRVLEGREKVKLEPKDVNWIVWMNVVEENVIEV